ncbi:MAG: tetratricopeptide repeat protein [Bacteroidales bacterium]|nr:tetratricopeptide repeat protein [Bacteroidales bacterium]
MNKLFDEAVVKHKEGKYKEALAIYKEILTSTPDHVQSLVNVGKLYLKVRKPEAAIPFFHNAINILPDNIEIKNSLARAYFEIKEFDKSQYILSEILLKNENYIPALINLSRLHDIKLNTDEVINIYNKILQLDPNSIIAINNLGNIYQMQGKVDKAFELFKKALAINPENAEVRLNMGNLYQIKGDLQKAMSEYRYALSLNPKMAAVYKNIANLIPVIYPYDEALRELNILFKTGVRIPDILLSAGVLAVNNSDYNLAIHLLKTNYEIFPDYFDNIYQLGVAYHHSGRHKKAVEFYEKGYAKKKDSEILLYAMAKAYKSLKNEEKYVFYLEKALEVNPEKHTIQHEIIRQRLNFCDWNNRKDDELNLKKICLEQIKSQSEELIPFLNLNYFNQDSSFLLECAKHSASNVIRKVIVNGKRTIFKHQPKQKDRIKIGYISPDFRNHPTGRVTVDFITNHNRDNFEVFCFSLIADLDDDLIQKKFKDNCEHYVSLYNVSDITAAKIINKNEIDILIDIAGYTTHSRAGILAYKPAPIQCQMIGFPGTMGSDFVQYIIADNFLIPEEHNKFYSEKVVRLPYSFPGSILDFDSKKKLRSDFNLPDDKFIFCCFNSQHKYSPEVFDAWVEILKNTPDSILLLKDGNENYKENIIEQASQRNLDKERIAFAQHISFSDYMTRNKVCDLFLDTFFYTAGSTAINALQVGLPVLTMAGKTNSSRMGGAIVNATELKDFITFSEKEYIEKAIYWGNNKAELDKIKESLQSDILNADLFNTTKYVANIEKSFSKMVEDYVSQKQIEHINV